MFSIVATLFYIPTGNWRVQISVLYLSTLAVFPFCSCFYYYSHSSGCEVEFHCDFMHTSFGICKRYFLVCNTKL